MPPLLCVLQIDRVQKQLFLRNHYSTVRPFVNPSSTIFPVRRIVSAMWDLERKLTRQFYSELFVILQGIKEVGVYGVQYNSLGFSLQRQQFREIEFLYKRYVPPGIS